MKKVVWIVLVALIAATVVVGTVGARKYKSSRQNDRGNGAFLGVVTESVDRALAERLDLAVDFGALIDRVLEGSPAEEAGLQVDDVIIEFDGTKVRDSEDLSDLLRHLDGDEDVKLVVRREGDKIDYTVELTDRGAILRGIRLPSNIGSIIAPSAPRAPRAPRAPSAPQALWYDAQHPYMGISMIDISHQLGEYFGVEKSRGVLVTEVEKDSPAEEAGIKAGDVIVRLDGDRIADYDDVRDIVSESDAGDKLKVVVIRDKNEMELEVTVDERGGKYRYNDRWGMRSLGDLDILFSGDDEVWSSSLDAGSGKYDFYLESDEFNREMSNLRDELEGLQHELHNELRELRDIQ